MNFQKFQEISLSSKNMLGKIKNFVTEVKLELSKVSWASRQELAGSTIVVIVLTGILAVYVGIVDLSLSQFLKFLIK